MTTYNKDREYTLKVVNTDNEVKEIKYTPDKDMSKPQLIMALKSKYKNFFKLLENRNLQESNDNLNVINELNALYKEFYNSKTDEKEIIKNKVAKILTDAPDGTAMYRVTKKNYSGWTSHGSYSHDVTELSEYKKDNGVWTMHGYKKPDVNDAVISILYNDGELMTKEDAVRLRDEKSKDDTSQYRDIVNVGTDSDGNPIGKSTFTTYYPNRKEESYTSNPNDLVDYASTKTEFKGFTKEIFKYIEQNLTKEFGDEWYKKSLIDLEDATYDIVEQYCTKVIDDDSINPTDFYKVVLDYVKSKEDMKVESMEKFDTLVIDNTGNSMLLKGASYNNACYWLEQKLDKENDKIESTSTDTVNTDITIIRTAKNKKFQYDESDGTLRLLEESKLGEAPQMEFKPLPVSLQKEIWNIEEMYQEDKLNSDDDIFEGTEDEYADEVLQQHIYDLFDTDEMKSYISENYNTTTQELANESANFVANKIYNAILEENTDILFNVDEKENEVDPNEFIANVDALYDKFGENNLPSGCTIQLSLGNKYLFSDKFQNGKEPVCCNGEHCKLMGVQNGMYHIINLHFVGCAFDLTKEEFLILSSYTVPIIESKDLCNNELMEVNDMQEDTNNDSVIVVNYDKGTRFPDRETAIRFYKECVIGTDPNSSEHYRYLNVLWNLENTKDNVVYDSEDDEEYNWWISKGKPVEDISQELLNAHLLEGNGDNNDTFVGKSLNSLLATLEGDGYDISDYDYDVAVFFPYIENVEDNYDEFIKQLGDELIIKEDYKDGDTTIIVGLRDYVNSHKDKLLSIFDIDDTMDDYDMEEYLVCEAMPAIISGNTTDSAYNDLIKGV